jgi:hypothetical protein
VRVSDRKDNNEAVQRNHPIKHIKKIDHLSPRQNKHTECGSHALTSGYQGLPAPPLDGGGVYWPERRRLLGLGLHAGVH